MINLTSKVREEEPFMSNNINLNGGLIMADNNYKIAQITQAEEKAIKKAEADVKAETGKDYVMIAWEKE